MGVSDPTLTFPRVWPTKEELKGEAWLGEDPPPPVAHDNYPTAELFASKIEATFYEERALDMVDGPFTRLEAAERCRCKPEELCPGPLAGIDESDKIRTIYDGSKGGANAHIQLIRRRRPRHRWLETASMPSTGSGQRRTIPIYCEPHSRARRRDLGMITSRCMGSPQVPRALRGPPGPERGRGTMETSDGWDASPKSAPSGQGSLPGAEGPDRRAPFPPTPRGEAGGNP